MAKDTGVEIVDNSDIYQSWGSNETRVDYPAFGPEYAAWKKMIPSDVQKTVLDYVVARNIWRSGGLPRSILDRNLIDYQPLPLEDYSKLREEALTSANQVADLVEPFLQNHYPELIPHLQAVGIDGSALYRPRLQSDIDVWIMFDQFSRVSEQAIRKLHRQELDKPGFIVDLRTVTSELVLDKDGLMMDIYSLLLPHKILKYYPDYDEVKHQEQIQKLIELARKSKINIYRVARMLVGVTKSQIT